jgi:hypothetical protein
MHILKNTICRWDSNLDSPLTFIHHNHISFDNVFSFYFEIYGYRYQVHAFYSFGTLGIVWVHQSLFAGNSSKELPHWMHSSVLVCMTLNDSCTIKIKIIGLADTYQRLFNRQAKNLKAIRVPKS